MEFIKNLPLFGRTRKLESRIEEYLDKVAQSALIFKLAVRIYIIEGPCLEFEEKLRQINELESKGDNLRRAVERELYTHTLNLINITIWIKLQF